MTPETVTVNWYTLCRAYEVAFREDTPYEAAFARSAFAQYGRGELTSFLEAGCGTGRVLRRLAHRGLTALGYDARPEAIEYLTRRYRRLREKVRGAGTLTAVVGDLRTFTASRPVDLALCWCNTFRHLLTDADVLAHLRHTAASVRPGGLYVVALHLLPPDADLYDSEHWTETAGVTTVAATLSVAKAFPERSLEVLRVTLDVTNLLGTTRYRDYMPLRTFTAAQIRTLLAAAPWWEHVATHDFNYDVEQPLALDDEIADTVLVLRRTAESVGPVPLTPPT